MQLRQKQNQLTPSEDLEAIKEDVTKLKTDVTTAQSTADEAKTLASTANDKKAKDIVVDPAVEGGANVQAVLTSLSAKGNTFTVDEIVAENGNTRTVRVGDITFDVAKNQVKDDLSLTPAAVKKYEELKANTEGNN